MSMWLLLGSSSSTCSTTVAWPSRRHLLSSAPDTHRLNHSLQRNAFIVNASLVHLVHHPDLPVTSEKARGQTSGLRSVQAQALGDSDQPVRHRLWRLHLYLVAISAHSSRHLGECELCRAGYARGDSYRCGGLVH